MRAPVSCVSGRQRAVERVPQQMVVTVLPTSCNRVNMRDTHHTQVCRVCSLLSVPVCCVLTWCGVSRAEWCRCSSSSQLSCWGRRTMGGRATRRSHERSAHAAMMMTRVCEFLPLRRPRVYLPPVLRVSGGATRRVARVHRRSAGRAESRSELARCARLAHASSVADDLVSQRGQKEKMQRRGIGIM